MSDPVESSERRRRLEQMLGEVVAALREQCGEGNLTVQLPETGDFVAILQIEAQEAKELAQLLSRPR
jgi:hypothetical protein